MVTNKNKYFQKGLLLFSALCVLGNFSCAGKSPSLSPALESQVRTISRGVPSRKYTYNKFTPKIKYRNGAGPGDLLSRKYLSEFEATPDHLQEIIQKYGGRIIFFNGKITDNPEWIFYRGKEIKNKEGVIWDDFRAGYLEGVFILE